MLGKLFGSNTRVKILKLFLLHPTKKYYIRQLARDLKLQINSVRRELENLESFGLLVSSTGKDDADTGEDDEFYKIATPEEEEKKNSKAKDKSQQINGQEKKYFQVNADFVLFEEIKSLIVKAQILHKDDFVNKIKKAGKIKLLILTGAFVNIQASAIDILIVGRFEKKEKVYRILKDLEKELGRELNYTIMDPKEFKYRRDMTDIFLYNVMDGKRIIAIDEIGLS